MKFKTPFSHDPTEPVKCETPSKTEQQFEYELNINNILSGQVVSSLPAQTSEALYGMKISADEFETQLNATQEVLNYFEQIPVKAKEFFDYKPGEMLKFIQNKDNIEKAYELGLVSKERFNAYKDSQIVKHASELKNESKSPSEVISGSNAEIIPNVTE